MSIQKKKHKHVICSAGKSQFDLNIIVRTVRNIIFSSHIFESENVQRLVFVQSFLCEAFLLSRSLSRTIIIDIDFIIHSYCYEDEDGIHPEVSVSLLNNQLKMM